MASKSSKKLPSLTVLTLVLLAFTMTLWYLVRLVKSQATLTQKPAENFQSVKVFLISLEDKGKSGKEIGCQDTAIPVLREIKVSENTLKATLEELFSIKEKYYGGSDLYNALANASLKVESAEITGNKAKIELSGTYQFTGVCEDARFIAQIEETAKQFPKVIEVEIVLNNKNLENLYKGD